jgi:hypothetical protein
MQVNRKLKKAGGGGNSVPRAPVVFSSSCTPGSHGSTSGLNFIERDI